MGMSHSDAIPPDRRPDRPDVEAVINTGGHDLVETRDAFSDDATTDLVGDWLAGPDEMSFIQAMLPRDHEAVVDSDVEFEEVLTEATDALDVAAAEHEMYQMLVECGAQGPEWELVVESLAAYANEVLDVWIRTGTIYRKLAASLISIAASHAERFRLAVNEDLREEILAETITIALEKLRSGIQDQTGWDPARGAKLKTYFLGGCLYAFKRALESQLRHESAPREQIDQDITEEPGGDGYGSLCNTGLGLDPADIVSNRDLIQQHLEQLDEYERRIVWAKAAGYTHPEIAQLFPPKTAKAIERKLARLAADHKWIANLSTRSTR